MAHYALLDNNWKVVNVITGKDENEPDNDGNPVDWEQYYSEFTGLKAVRTSYNTRGGVHLNGGTPFRYNYAIIGGEFLPNVGPDGAFLDPKPYYSWELNYDTMRWEAPYPEPVPGEYFWFESVRRWIPAEEM